MALEVALSCVMNMLPVVLEDVIACFLACDLVSMAAKVFAWSVFTYFQG